MNRASMLGTAAVGLSVLGLTTAAHAETCASLPNPVYISGSTAVVSALQGLAKALGSTMTIVNVGGTTYSGSCSGAGLLNADVTPTGACAPGGCATGSAKYYATDGNTVSNCDLPAGGQHADVNFSDVFMASCNEGTPLTNPNLRETSLLVLPFGFITATASSQVAIDASEAYFVYGDGAVNGMVQPWVNQSQVFQRDSGSGTQITTFKNVHVPVGVTFATNAGATGPMLTDVSMPTNAQQVLGFAGLDQVFAKQNTTPTKPLAFRAYGQKAFYWSGSTSTAQDMQNVRDGHYPLWSYEHAFTLVDGSGNAVSANATKLINYLTGAAPLPTSDYVAVEASTGVLPLCAMDVARTKDAGDFSVATTQSCSCYYQKNTPNGTVPASCQTCTKNTDCSTGHCNFGYCEAR